MDMIDTSGREKKRFLLFLAFIVPVYIIVTAVFYKAEPWIIGTSLPAIEKIIRKSYPDAELVAMKYNGIGGRRSIEYNMKVTVWLKGVNIPLIDYLRNSLYVSSQFITVIIFYTLLFSWPFVSLRKRLAAAVVSLPVIALFFFVDTSVSVVASIEIECQRRLHGIVLQETFHKKSLMFLGHFFNNGGRQFLGVLLFVLSVIPVNFSRPLKQETKISRRRK